MRAFLERRPRARALARAGALVALGAYVYEAVVAVRTLLELDELAGAPQLDEEALRRELREIGGLGPDTVETILLAARAPSP